MIALCRVCEFRLLCICVILLLCFAVCRFCYCFGFVVRSYDFACVLLVCGFDVLPMVF